MKTFNPVYAGKDVIAQARTGTGKTFSFAIPLIEKLQGESQERRRGRPPKVTVPGRMVILLCLTSDSGFSAAGAAFQVCAGVS